MSEYLPPLVPSSVSQGGLSSPPPPPPPPSVVVTADVPLARLSLLAAGSSGPSPAEWLSNSSSTSFSVFFAGCGDRPVTERNARILNHTFTEGLLLLLPLIPHELVCLSVKEGMPLG